jgi:exodeoxyribonuclease V alpha subunit
MSSSAPLFANLSARTGNQPAASGGSGLSLSTLRNKVEPDDEGDFGPPPEAEWQQAPERAQAPVESDLEEFSCKIVHRIFPRTFTKDDEFAVYAVEDDSGKSAKITGVSMYRPEKHERVTARGKWTMYKGEMNFKAVMILPEIPKSAKGVMTWMKTAKIEGVGKATQLKIAKHFGDDLLDVLDKALEDPDSLCMAGIKPVQARRIGDAWHSQVGQPRLVEFLGRFGLGEMTIAKIVKRFGGASRRIVDENPWRLAEAIDGIGFQTADRIGKEAGHDPKSPARIKAGLRFTLSEMTNKEGHCGLKRDDLIRGADRMLGVGSELIEPVIDEIVADRDAIEDKELGLVYPNDLHKAELSLAERLMTIMRRGDRVEEEAAREAVEAAVLKLGVNRDESQVAAAVMAVGNPVSIITGGPGTGKSTTQRIIVAALEHLGKTFVLAAPTGRASKRLSEVTSKDAATCHRLLSFSAEKGGFLFDRSNPFTQQRFIVDEFSMIDLRLGSSFLAAVKDSAGITIVGDVDQLPSVGPGQVLKDLIDSGMVPTTRLKNIHRQSGDSGIVVAAARVNSGEVPLKPGEKLDGFYMKTNFGDWNSEEEIIRDVVDFMSRRLPGSGFNPVDDIQVLAAMKSGPLGIERLNVELKNALNPATEENSVKLKGRDFSVGDRVMHLRNDYQKKVYNGEVGIVIANGQRNREDGKTEPYIKVDYSGHHAYYGPEDSNDIIMAWASTVHKSQGCEFPVVIMVVPNGHRRMLTRNLFYTAVTRAKKVCIVLGNGGAIQHAVKTEDLNRRSTGLSGRLKTAA